MPLFAGDRWPHYFQRPTSLLLSEVPPGLRGFQSEAVVTTDPTSAQMRFLRAQARIDLTVWVLPDAGAAKRAMKQVCVNLLSNPMFLRRGRNLRGLGQGEQRADDDWGTEGILLGDAGYFHHMRLNNLVVATWGLNIEGDLAEVLAMERDPAAPHQFRRPDSEDQQAAWIRRMHLELAVGTTRMDIVVTAQIRQLADAAGPR